MRVVSGVKTVVAVAMVAAAVSSCSVSGEPVRSVGLSTKAVPGEAFPYGPGQPVPSAQVPGILADITYRPLRADNDPADCTPAPLDTSTAQVQVGPGGPAQGTLTAVVAQASDSFDDFVSQLRRCEMFTVGGTVGTSVSTRMTDTDPAAGIVILERRIVMGPAGETSQPPRTAVTEFVAQRGRVRVYVQNRRSGEAPLAADEREATRKLFDQARSRAFGD